MSSSHFRIRVMGAGVFLLVAFALPHARLHAPRATTVDLTISTFMRGPEQFGREPFAQRRRAPHSGRAEEGGPGQRLMIKMGRAHLAQVTAGLNQSTFPYRLFRSISYPLRSSVIPMSSECAGRKPVRSILAFETM